MKNFDIFVRFNDVKIRQIVTVTLLYTIKIQLLMELKYYSTLVKLKISTEGV